MAQSSRRLTTPAQATDPQPKITLPIAAAAYFILAFCYFLPALLPGRHIFGTDYLNGGYFFYHFIAERFAAGSLPKWVPYVFGGVPLLANPASTYYPIRFIADWIAPASYFLPILFVFQFAIAGLGTWLLARELGCRAWVAFVAGLAFQWTGILTSWVYAGHDGRIIVVTLAPLFFYFIHGGVRTGRLAYFAGLAATTAGFLLSFQIQNAYYLLLSGALWALFALALRGRGQPKGPLAKPLLYGLGAIAFGFLTASVVFLPFRDYVKQSPRGQTGGRGYEYSTSYSMPARALVGLAVPEQVGATIQNERGEYIFPIYRGSNPFRLHTEYVGATVVLLVALGFFYLRRNANWWFFSGLGLFALSLALGGHTPLYRLYYALPGLKRFRAPDLAYYLLAFSLVVMAALALERLAEIRENDAARGTKRSSGRPEAAPVLWIVAGVGLIALLGAGVFGVRSAPMAEGTVGLTPAQGWIRFLLFASLIGGSLVLWLKQKLPTRVVFLLLALITVSDLWVIGKRFFQTVPSPEEMFAEDDVIRFIRSQLEPGRVWPLSREWPRAPDYPMLYDVELAAGEHGNQLQTYNLFAGAGQNSYVDFHNFNDQRFMDAANIRWLTASEIIQAPGLREAYRSTTQPVVVYENTAALPRAYLVGEVIPVADNTAAHALLLTPRWQPRKNAVVETNAQLTLPGTPLQGGARVERYSPDSVSVTTQANQQALLVLSDNYYQDWRATIDGQHAQILRTNGTFRGVVVPAGSHRVDFVFDSTDLRTGFYIYLVCFAILAGYGAWLMIGHYRKAGRTSGPGRQSTITA